MVTIDQKGIIHHRGFMTRLAIGSQKSEDLNLIGLINSELMDFCSQIHSSLKGY